MHLKKAVAKELWRQRPIKANLQNISNTFIDTHFPGGKYFAIHARRLETACLNFRAYTVDEVVLGEVRDYCNLTPEIMRNHFQKNNISTDTPVYLSTDFNPEYRQIDEMLIREFNAKTYTALPELNERQNLFVEIDIMQKGTYFLGHIWSSMSGYIAVGREASGFPMSTNLIPGYYKDPENLMCLTT